jgi:hypothetical protein
MKLTTPRVAVAVGAILVAAALLLPRQRPRVELSFVRYTNFVNFRNITCAVLELTNRGSSRLWVMNTADLGFASFSQPWARPGFYCELPERSGTQFIVWPSPVYAGLPVWPPALERQLPPAISMQYRLRGGFLQGLLNAAFHSKTGAVVSVALPPR